MSRYQLKKTLSTKGKRIGRPPKAQLAEKKPAATESASPAPSPQPPAAPDTDIFGKSAAAPETAASASEAENAAASQDGDKIATETPPANGTPPPDKEQHRSMATFVFDTVTNLLASFIGGFWLPRPKKENADVTKGELPYDEREMVLTAIIDYFDSVGMKILSPLQKLWLAIATYSAPRLFLTISWLKNRAKKPTPPPAAGAQPDPRAAKTETAPPPQTPPASAPATTGITETEQKQP